MLSGLSSRRRLTLLAPIVVLAVVLAAVAVHRLTRSTPGAHSRLPAQDRPGPVLLVPGFGGQVSSLEPLAARLRSTGRSVTLVRLPDDGTGELEEQARVLDAAVRDAVAPARGIPAGPGAATSVDLVGYSAGGVVVRLWAKEYDGEHRARRIVTLGSPHHGTTFATLGVALLPEACPPACRQLVPRSELLQRLNRGDETPDGPRWVSVWTTQDETVTPPDSARLDGAVDVPLQAVCADAAVTHSQLPADPLAVGLVLRALDAGPVPTPSTADCSSLRALGAG